MRDFLSNVTPNSDPFREGEQKSKPLSLWGSQCIAGVRPVATGVKGFERGFKNKLHIALNRIRDQDSV